MVNFGESPDLSFSPTDCLSLSLVLAISSSSWGKASWLSVRSADGVPVSIATSGNLDSKNITGTGLLEGSGGSEGTFQEGTGDMEVEARGTIFVSMKEAGELEGSSIVFPTELGTPIVLLSGTARFCP